MNQNDKGWIKTLLDKAENETMHLVIFIETAKPNALARFIVLLAKFFWQFYLIL